MLPIIFIAVDCNKIDYEEADNVTTRKLHVVSFPSLSNIIYFWSGLLRCFELDKNTDNVTI